MDSSLTNSEPQAHQFCGHVESNVYKNIVQAMFDNSPHPVYVLDTDGRICDVNQAACEMQACDSTGLIGRLINEIDPASKAYRNKRVARLLNGESITFRGYHDLPDGTSVPLEVFATPYQHNDETRILCVCRDIRDLEKAEALIRKQSERPRLALSSANQGIYDLNVQTGECVVSDEYASMLGYDPETFVETNTALIERLHPDDRESVTQKYLDYVSGKIKDYRVEFRQRMADGRWKWILSIGKIIEHDENGQPLRFVGTHTDISDMKSTQLILEKEAERPKLALSVTNQGLWDYNLVTGEVYTNDDYARMLGYDPETFHSNFEIWREAVHPDDLEPVMQIYQEVLSGQAPDLRSEFRQKHKNGEWLWILTSGRVVERDQNGNPLRMIGTNTNITEFKAAQEILEKEAERPRLALSNTKQGFYDCNTQTGYVFVSQEYADMLGYQPNELNDIHNAWSNHLHPDDKLAAEQRFKDCMNGDGKPYRAEFRMRTRDDRYIWILSMGNIVEWDEKGMPVRFVGTHTDITEMKLEQESLEARQQHMTQQVRLSLANGLASVVAHELNQPLCAVVNHLAAIQHELNSSGQETKALSEDVLHASDAAHRAADIIRRFRSLYTMRRLNEQLCDVKELIESCLELVAGELQRAGVQVRLEFEPDTPLIYADPILLQQVILNLTHNAIDSMPKAGDAPRLITLSLSKMLDQNIIKLSVADTGVGFDEKSIESAFDVMHSSKSDGLGIGLCICRLIIRSHRGEIRLKETGPKGSVIEICLPIDNRVVTTELLQSHSIFSSNVKDS